jgi:hypothetical protein
LHLKVFQSVEVGEDKNSLVFEVSTLEPSSSYSDPFLGIEIGQVMSVVRSSLAARQRTGVDARSELWQQQCELIGDGADCYAVGI